MSYIPHSQADLDAMLARIGVASPTKLFSSIPAHLQQKEWDLPEPFNELELSAHMKERAALNHPLEQFANFLGAGVYNRFVPAIVRSTTARPEFYTAYTPYQAEASQGTLQTIFEFQSMMAELMGMDLSNASLYDGATAAAEAMILALDYTQRKRVAVGMDLHPDVRAVLQTFGHGRNIQIDWLPLTHGVVTPANAAAVLTKEHAAVLLAQPSFLGCIADHEETVEHAHSQGALAIAYADPLSAAVLKPAGAVGFDVAVGEAQQLGIAPSYGGPLLGFMAVTAALMRRIPGRLAGMTRTSSGERAFTLTLQAREQHIRRERATSNICTNHALLALAATAYMGYMGAGGMKDVVTRGAVMAHRLAEDITSIPGFSLAFPQQPFLNEFVLKIPVDTAAFTSAMHEAGVIAGLPLSDSYPELQDCLLVSCTEVTQKEDIAKYIDRAGDTTNTLLVPEGERSAR